MPSRRILITGLSTFWGGRLAQALEADDDVEAIIGIDRTPPKVELDRTEFVQVADHHTLIRRIVQGAEIDTVVDTRLVTDSITTSPRKTHENNIIGTMNILAACTGPQTTVRKVVFRSSALYYGSEQDDPAFFTEDMRRKRAARTPLERDIVEAEGSVGDFAAKHPETTVTVLRFAHGLGPDMRSSLGQLLSLPVVPMILGFDPRLQFVHEDDVAGALTHAVTADLPGIYNVAGDGVLALSEVAGLLGKPIAPVLPPWGTSLALPIARRLGVRIPPELVSELRFGRGLDNRRLKATGYRLRHTSRETVELLREHQRIAPYTRDRLGPYRYEREVEDFLRWSPSVRREGEAEWRPTREQITELRRALDALERGDAPTGTPSD
jgi:UDP-glucose 4-epimerase